MKEQYFTPEDRARIAIQPGEGLYVATSQPFRNQRVGEVGPERTPVVWQLASEPVLQMGVVAAYSSIEATQAMTIQHGGDTVSGVKFALYFANYLNWHRSRSARNTDLQTPPVTTVLRPGAEIDRIRIPHLAATISKGKKTLADTVVWEIFTTEQAENWLGAPLPSQEVREDIEENLFRILHLRRALRERQLPDTLEHRAIEQHLQKLGRYPSMLFVYQHAQLFSAMFAAEEELAKHQPQQGTP